jgi:hypothetical protein
MILYLFVEGEWDRIFFETFLCDYLLNKYPLAFDDIKCIEYSESLSARSQFRALVKRNEANFLLCPDLDAQYDDSKRITKIRKLATEEFKVEYETIKDKAFVIVQEIESWYLAGFKQSFCEKKRIKFYPNTAITNKTTFENIADKINIPPSRLRDILVSNKNLYFIEEAKERNESFSKFLEKVASQAKKLS